MKTSAQRSPVRVALLLGVVALATAGPVSRSGAAAAQGVATVDIPKLKLTDFTLKNGLRVVMHEDHSAPIVDVEMWYNAGSKFDPKGKTGIAHMFEHMLDEGTSTLPPGEYKRIIQSAGGGYNASTQNDMTRYWTTIPSNQLETVLWLEADRLTNLAIDPARFTLERDAVRNEYRQNVLGNAPQMAAAAMIGTLFTEGAYAPPSFGYPADLASITPDDMRRFYDTYYVPNNAVLVVVGDFNTAQARAMVEKYLGAIPRGKNVTFPTSVTPLHGETRAVVENGLGNRGVWIGWRGAKSASPDRPALVALSAILTQRLRTILVDQRRVAAVINPAWNQAFDLQESGIFQIALTPNATASATMFEEVADSVIASIKTSGVTDAEVKRWVASNRMQLLTDMQSVTSVANNIGDGALNQHNPLAFYEMADRAQRVTAAQVQAAAKKYLTSDRVVISIIPTGKFDLASKPNLPYVNATPKGQ